MAIVSTSGSLPDLDGYLITLDAGAPKLVTGNDTLVLATEASVPHVLALSGLADNCVLLGDPASVWVTTGAADTANAVFKIACNDPAVLGDLSVSVVPGLPTSNPSFRVFIDGALATPSDVSEPGSLQLTLPAGRHQVQVKARNGAGELCSVTGPAQLLVDVPVGSTLAMAFASGSCE